MTTASDRRWQLAFYACVVICAALLFTETGFAFFTWVSDRRVGLFALSVFLILLRVFSRIFDRYGWIHFAAAFWVMSLAIIMGEWVGAPHPYVVATSGASSIAAVLVMFRYALLVRERNRRRLELCGLVERAHLAALERIRALKDPRLSALEEDIAAAAAHQGHLTAHVAGYGD